MRRFSAKSTLVASALVSGVMAAIAASPPVPRIADETTAPAVDVELIFAVDVSHSMTSDELAVQREGYAEAIHSYEFLQALQAGQHGKISVTYFEWSSSNDQKVIVPWRLIDGPETAAAVAQEILRVPAQRGAHTSISGAIRFAMPLFDLDPYSGTRRVIDISGDGPNNSGPPVSPIRNEALAKGLVINGLPIMLNDSSATMDIENLDWYYEDCIVGGPGSFVIPIRTRDDFKQAIVTKLVREVSDRTPALSTKRVSDEKPRVDCAIREKIFNER